MPSASYRVVINKLDPEHRDELCDELAEELGRPVEEIDELLAELPATVARNLTEDDAEDLADVLEDLGARVRIVEVARRRRRRVEAEEGEEDEAGEAADVEGAAAAADSPSPGARPPVPPAARGQRLMLIAGLCVLALLVGMLGVSMFGGSLGSAGCGGSFRGSGANAQLAAQLPQYAERYARGFQPQEAVAHGELAANSSATLREEVSGPACFIWIGLANQGTDLDLHLRHNGQLVAQDRGEDNYPVVRHCVDEETTVEVDVQMFAGGGEWVLQRYVLVGQPGEDLLTLMHKLYSSMFVVNGQPVGPLKRLHLRAGQEAEIYVEMEAEWCYLPLAVSGPGTDLDMYLLDPQGREIERDDAVDNYPVLRHCPMKAGRYRLKLMMYGGESDAVYQVYRGKLGGSRAGGPDAPGAINVPGASPGEPVPAPAPAAPAADAGASPTTPAVPAVEPPGEAPAAPSGGSKKP